MQSLNDAGRRIAHNTAWMLDEFRRLNRNIEAGAVMVFFLIAEKPGIRMKEIEKATGLSSSAVSRNVLLLTAKGWREDVEGLDLVVTAADPTDVRAKVVMLTQRGRKMFEKIVVMLDQ